MAYLKITEEIASKIGMVKGEWLKHLPLGHLQSRPLGPYLSRVGGGLHLAPYRAIIPLLKRISLPPPPLV